MYLLNMQLSPNIPGMWDTMPWKTYVTCKLPSLELCTSKLPTYDVHSTARGNIYAVFCLSIMLALP